MPFVIQASSPRWTGAHDPEDSTLSEAVQVVFPMEAEAAVLEWNHVPGLLSYRYDISICLDDVIDMLTTLMSCDGVYENYWPSTSTVAAAGVGGRPPPDHGRLGRSASTAT